MRETREELSIRYADAKADADNHSVEETEAINVALHRLEYHDDEGTRSATNGR